MLQGDGFAVGFDHTRSLNFIECIIFILNVYGGGNQAKFRLRQHMNLNEFLVDSCPSAALLTATYLPCVKVTDAGIKFSSLCSQ